MRLPKPSSGFTLIELLIVIAILAVLATIGLVAFGNLTPSAQDARRKEDIQAMSKAFEVEFVKNGSTNYINLTAADFATGSIPQDPRGVPYNLVIGPAQPTIPPNVVPTSIPNYPTPVTNDGNQFKICAALNLAPTPISSCTSSNATCYCVTSSLK